MSEKNFEWKSDCPVDRARSQTFKTKTGLDFFGNLETIIKQI